MFDRNKYMREWRKNNPRTPEQKRKAVEAVRRCVVRKRATDPAWVERERARARVYAKKRRQDPDFRKAAYLEHAKWVAKNRDRVNANQRRWAQSETYRRKAKERLLRIKYGLSLEEYHRKIQQQHGACPICKGPLVGRVATDHNHATGQVRSILCSSCNRWIGFIENYTALVKPMLRYLKKWNRVGTIKQIS